MSGRYRYVSHERMTDHPWALACIVVVFLVCLIAGAL